MNFYKSMKTNSIFDWILLFLLSLFFLNFVNTFEGNTSLEYDQELEELWYWNKEDYPNPHEQPPYCRRTRPSYICDPDQVLSRKEGKYILMNNLCQNQFKLD